MRKPFGDIRSFRKFTRLFAKLLQLLEDLGLGKGSRLLELGCGSGWMAEFLALYGYSVLGTTIAPDDVELGNQRVEALRAKGLRVELAFRVSAMESVDTGVAGEAPFDGVFVFEALHHAFDWRQAIRAARAPLKRGGWLVLANEPNRLHTFISYRVARLSHTHEIGVRQLRDCGFREVRILQPRLNNLVREHWIAARK